MWLAGAIGSCSRVRALQGRLSGYCFRFADMGQAP